MAQSLLEAYKDRLAVADRVYSKSHNGEALTESKKLIVAKVLENTNKFITEAFSNSVGTQRSNLGDYKKFTLNLTNVALPNLISYDLVIVQPMASFSGFITYIEYTAGSNKGTTKQGDVFNSPFRLGNADVNYTSATVSETHKATAAEVAAHAFKVDWTPVLEFQGIKIGNTTYNVVAAGSEVSNTSVSVAKDGTITFAANDASFVADAEVKVLYVYDNVVIPQNDLPILNAEIKSIALVAKARRIAIYYSQIANYQAKTDYGFDLGDQLAEKAVGQLSYEIDTEVTNLLADNAAQDGDLVWSKTLPVGVSKMEHYNGFLEVIEMAKQKVYDRTKKFAPNYMLVSSSLMPVLSFINGFNAASTSGMNGPYFAGTLAGLKVFVTPNIEQGKFVLGVNGDDLMSSAAVYAPYMAIVPTQLLQYADGANSQGFSTLYALELLNKDLLVAGRITA